MSSLRPMVESNMDVAAAAVVFVLWISTFNPTPSRFACLLLLSQSTTHSPNHLSYRKAATGAQGSPISREFRGLEETMGALLHRPPSSSKLILFSMQAPWYTLRRPVKGSSSSMSCPDYAVIKFQAQTTPTMRWKNRLLWGTNVVILLQQHYPLLTPPY